MNPPSSKSILSKHKVTVYIPRDGKSFFHPIAKDNKTGREVTRNSVCPCGSGKRFKKCCGKGHK